MNRAVDLARSLGARIRQLTADRCGLAAIEFAMLLPLMVTLFLGVVEVSQGIATDRKVTITARTVADLVAQAATINNADMTNVLNAAAAVMSPYPVANLKVVVSSVSIDANGKATVDWSDTLNGTAHAPGSTVTVPDALKLPKTTLIWGEAEYLYTPSVGYVLTGSLTLKDQIYMRPRQSDCVTRDTGSAKICSTVN